MALKLEPGTRLVLATHNPGKARELAEILDNRFEVVSAGELGLAEPEETESTFVGNALLKARAAAEASGLVALADDSGISVAALAVAATLVFLLPATESRPACVPDISMPGIDIPPWPPIPIDIPMSIMVSVGRGRRPGISAAIPARGARVPRA